MKFIVSGQESQKTLAAVLRLHADLTWNAARALVATGKVFVDTKCQLDPNLRVIEQMEIEVRERAPAPLSAKEQQAQQAIVYEDSQLVVVEKPAGMSSVPYERGEINTAMDLIRSAWRLQKRKATVVPLHIVHRIDKETSGLLMFAKTKTAERNLQELLRAHDIERSYVCIAHGQVYSKRIESAFITDRGDGLRGSAVHPTQQARGKRAVTHVEVLQPLAGATLCRVTLETGKTHQIRIHLAEDGHPLIGEKVYIRDFTRQERPIIEAPRLMLHAETLGFVHPTTGKSLRFTSEPPEDFKKMVQKLDIG